MICWKKIGLLVILQCLVTRAFPQDTPKYSDSIKTIFRPEFVVTGTKTFKKKTDSPVMVNVLDSKALNDLQACNLSDGLKFQTGLRVETNCQTCNYTQLRMNGLQGGYSQVLFNGRPLFSPLMGLYGLEHIPSNLIDRIEVVRGGGSSLYGSSAIGGTVNIITRFPKKNEGEFQASCQNIGNQASDYSINGNGTLMNDKRSAGITAFVNSRKRGFFDANNDGFSEIPKMNLLATGFHGMFQRKSNQKLEFSASRMEEYRLGGDISLRPLVQLEQVEERQHVIGLGSIDCQVNFNEGKSSWIIYSGFQKTNRQHFTGILPDDSLKKKGYQSFPPNGTSFNLTFQGGMQLNHQVQVGKFGKNVFTFGSEFLQDSIRDLIPRYRYRVEQTTKNWGSFVQSDWEWRKNINLLSGLRLDLHNFLNQPVWSPRFALLFKPSSTIQMRMNYGTGFRAPQAFDSDLHVAFAGGGVSRVRISPVLREERSKSWSSSLNVDYPTEKWIAGGTIEAFSTQLIRVFVLENVGVDTFGEIFEKRNGMGANVRGVTLEFRMNYAKKVQLEAGFTTQRSQYEEAIEVIQGLPKVSEFLRTPRNYGFGILNITPNSRWSFNVNTVYTGRMQIAHFGGAINQESDRLVTSQNFWEWNWKCSFILSKLALIGKVEAFLGMKNMLNSFQADFDLGKNRDSNYIYGPNFPRSFFGGIKWTK
jgi:outer membrane receptor for ferrienterochelin and colicins